MTDGKSAGKDGKMRKADVELLRRSIARRDDTIASLREQLEASERARQELKSRAEWVTTEAESWRQRALRVQARLDVALETQQTLITRLADAASNSGEVVEKILTGIAPLFLGYREDAKARAEGAAKVLETEMGSLGLDDMAGVPPGTFFPDIEFDESMESRDKWPEPGTMTDPTKRADGQPMFRAGTTASPPVSGVE